MRDNDQAKAVLCPRCGAYFECVEGERAPVVGLFGADQCEDKPTSQCPHMATVIDRISAEISAILG